MTITNAELRQFTGTENYHRVPLRRDMVITDGVQYLADKASAYWLVDVVASHLPEIKKYSALHDEMLFTVELVNKGDDGAFFKVSDGNEKEVLHQNIEFTDFPFASLGPDFRMFLSWSGNFWVLFLCSEY